MDKDPLMNPNLPRVQVPVGRKRAGLTVDGDFIPYWNLPKEAQEAYDRFVKYRNRVYQCNNCGYLTMSKRVGKYKAYSCSNCGKELRSRESFRLVYGGVLEEARIDVPNADPDDFPNTGAHLTKMKNEIKKSLTMHEMLYEAARAVKKHSDPLRHAVEVATGRSEGGSFMQSNLEDFEEEAKSS